MFVCLSSSHLFEGISTCKDIDHLCIDRKNVEQLFGSHKYNRRLGKWSTDTNTDSWSSGKKNSNSWSTSDSSDTDDDGMCGCSSYLDDSDSSSSGSWSSGKKSSKTSWSSGKKSSTSGSGSGKWSTGTDTTATPTSMSTTSNNDTMNFCDCLCSCNNSTTSVTVTSSTTDRRRSRNRRLGKWSTSGDGGCGSSWSSGKKNSASGKKNSASGASGKWSTDTSMSSTTGEPCFSTTYEPITCQCSNTSMSTTSGTEEEETTSGTGEGCEEGTNYMILGPGWEYYLASEDNTIVLSGKYDQDGTQFVYENGDDIALWWEDVGTDHVFVVGNESDVRYQLYYIDYVSTWTNDDNPLTDSDDENEWESGDESAEFITGNITLYDCEGNNLGTDVYTAYSHAYLSSGLFCFVIICAFGGFLVF